MEVLKYRKDINSPWQEIAALVGPPGKDGTVAFEELTDAQRASLKGDKGDKGDIGPVGPQGPQGEKGADGTMSFSDLTEEQKASLKGDPGATGPQGPQGERGPQGATGAQGPRGYTPVRGVDYWTAADKQEIINQVGSGNVNLSNYYTKAEVNSLLSSLEVGTSNIVAGEEGLY